MRRIGRESSSRHAFKIIRQKSDELRASVLKTLAAIGEQRRRELSGGFTHDPTVMRQWRSVWIGEKFDQRQFRIQALAFTELRDADARELKTSRNLRDSAHLYGTQMS